MLLSLLVLELIFSTCIGKYLLVDLSQELQSRKDSENDFTPINGDEIRIFKIDKDKKRDCKLPADEIGVKKIIPRDPTSRKFEVVHHEKDAYVLCSPGYVHYLSAKGKTTDCGIGKILMKLCLNEDKMHNVENKENEAMTDIQDWIDDCKREKSCEDHEDKLIQLQKWVNAECSKIVGMHMSSDPKTKAYVYFNSALESHFSKMFIQIGVHDMYPKDDCRSVLVLKDRYNENGEMVDGDDKVSVYLENWFFCKPKRKRPNTCDTQKSNTKKSWNDNVVI